MIADPGDPVLLAQALLRCPSVTGQDGDGEKRGAQDVLADALGALGFAVTRLPFGPDARVEGGASTPNLWATIGTGAPHLCFCGHTDVVPPGPSPWRDDPWGGVIRDDRLWGRGAVDMKGAIAAFVAAVASRRAAGDRDVGGGTVSLLVTGDEEGDARHGTARVVDWLRGRGALPDFCLVGEPTNPRALGDTVKHGRRGSLNATVTMRGRQGHAAYPERADNPVHRLVALLADLCETPLDDGTASFAPSTLQVTTVDVGNPATNVIPPQAVARLNIRFNDRHDGASLRRHLEAVAARHAGPCGASVEVRVSGEPFLAPRGPALDALLDAVEAETGRRPALDTGGGTSDARFLAPHCPVAEFGLVGATMHATDEHVSLADLRTLTAIYRRFLDAMFAPAGAGRVDLPGRDG